MRTNRKIHEVCRKLGHINLSYNKNTGVSGEKRICGHPTQDGNKADVSLFYKIIGQCILSTFEQAIFISSRQASLYFPSKASLVHFVVIETQSQ